MGVFLGRNERAHGGEGSRGEALPQGGTGKALIFVPLTGSRHQAWGIVCEGSDVVLVVGNDVS